MGRGDRRTKRGKIFKQSYGKHRPAKKNHVAYVPKPSLSEEIIEKTVIVKHEATPAIKVKKEITVKVVKKATPEKKVKVLKIEELSPEVLAEVKIEKPEKKVAAVKKVTVVEKVVADKKVATVKKVVPEKKTSTETKVFPEKKAATIKKASIEKEPKTADQKASKPKIVASKSKPAAKKTKS